MRLRATIKHAELDPTGYFILIFDVAGRTAFSGLHLTKSDITQPDQDGQRALSALCHAVGKTQLTDASQLIGLSLSVNVEDIKGPRCGSFLVVTDW